jgi:hypothetical protein
MNICNLPMMFGTSNDHKLIVVDYENAIGKSLRVSLLLLRFLNYEFSIFFLFYLQENIRQYYAKIYTLSANIPKITITVA